jgi:very-short-patch-repair endonuclease
MDNKIEKWLEKRGQDIKEEWIDITKTDIIRKGIESPIEKLFLVEWRYQTQFYDDFRDFFITQQYYIGEYRVDFVIYEVTLDEWFSGGKSSYPDTHKERCLVIELDSYVYHGSDPEQFTKEKERERELKKEGWDIMRFSGREVYRDVEKCVKEALEYISNVRTKILEKEIDEYEKNDLKGK